MTPDAAVAQGVTILDQAIHQQAINGNPCELINAVGDPIAAGVALFSIASGIEVLVLIDATRSIIDDFAGLTRVLPAIQR